MDASTLNLKNLFEPDRRYLVPLFQRPYVWDAEKQWKPLWEDVRALAERLEVPGEVRPHFLGAIVLDQIRQPTSRVEARLVIDGQQRLTTLQLLLEAASDVCRTRGWDKYHRAFLKLTRNEDPLSEEPDDAFKVWPTNADQKAFRRVMAAESPDGLKAEPGNDGTVLASAIAQAYFYFSAAISDWLPATDPASTDRIHLLYTALREKLRMVVIDLADKDDPQLIFETLNARGTPLLPADLVKNHLFHLARRADRSVEVLHDKYWKHFDEEAAYWRQEVVAGRVKRPRIDLFLQHYVAMQTAKEVQVAHLYSEFQDYLKTYDREPEEELASIARYSEVFRSFDEYDRRNRIGVFLSRLEDLEVTTAHPLLLCLFSLKLEQEDLEAAVVAIESFIVRRLVCHLTTKGYNKLFLDVLRTIQNERQDVASALKRALLSASGDTARWPSDRELEEAWHTVPIYLTQARRRTRMILEALEVEIRGPKTERISLPKNLTIEHIMPQSWQEHWPLGPVENLVEARENRDRLLHTIGNLTLLTEALNPATSNGDWTTKRAKIQHDSILVLNNRVAEKDTWDEGRIRSRAADLLALARRLWPRPDSPVDDQFVLGTYEGLGRRLMAETSADADPVATSSVACPIPQCPFVFKKGVMGWDGHIAELAKHPVWHPEITDKAARRAVFRMEFPEFPVADAGDGVVDRVFWERRADPRALAVVEELEQLLSRSGMPPRVAYARHYIAFGGPKQHYCWLRPQRQAAYCSIHLRVEKSRRSELCARLGAVGIKVSPNEKSSPRIELTADDVTGNGALLQELFELAFRHTNT